jgi:hypothetical protein
MHPIMQWFFVILGINAILGIPSYIGYIRWCKLNSVDTRGYGAWDLIAFAFLGTALSSKYVKYIFKRSK